MQSLSYDAETPLSAWRNSDSKVFAQSLEEVSQLLDPVRASENNMLVDPPLQRDEIKAGTKVADSRDEIKTPLTALESLLSLPDQKPNTRITKRIAPSSLAEKQDVNTIEIVKKDGLYSVVMDGVSYGKIEPSEDQTFEDKHYWMPRFKEKRDQAGNRVTQPVVVSLRFEEYETPPNRCTLKVIQRVVNDGTVVMEGAKVREEQIQPYSVSDSTCRALMLPYPMICTPEPYFVVNDYSRMRKSEVMLTLTKDKAFYERTKTFLRNTLQRVRTGEKTMGWRDYAEWTAALALAVGYGPVSGALAGGLGGMATIFAWQFLSSAYGTREFEITDEDRERYLSIHEKECGNDPVEYKFTMHDLANSLLRIAETRANGSLVDGTDRTIGFSVHDLGSSKWRAEAALLMWLQHGEMNRVKSDKDKPDSVSGRYSTQQNIQQNQRLRDNTSMPGITGNTISLVGMDPLSVTNTRTQFSFRIDIEEQDGTAGPTIYIDSTRVNGVDAGWVASGYDALLKRCKDTATWLEVKLMTLPGVAGWFRGHSTLVADTNNGMIVGNRFKIDINEALSRVLPKNASEKAQEGDAATGRLKESEKQVFKVNADIQKYENDLDKALESYKQKLQDNKDRAEKRKQLREEQLSEDLKKIDRSNKSDQEKQNLKAKTNKEFEEEKAMIDKVLKTKNEALATNYRKRRLILEAFLNRSKSNVLGANSQLFAEQKADQKAKEVQKIRTEHTSKEKEFANLFDYKKTMRRLREVLLGEQYSDLEEPTVESELQRLRNENVSQMSFWKRFMGNTDSFEDHKEVCRESLCKSLSIDEPKALDTNSVMLLRFVNMYSPLSDEKNTKVMKFASFVVPNTSRWEKERKSSDSSVKRILPQIVIPSNALNIKPVALDPSVLREQPKALNSVESSRNALSRSSKTAYFTIADGATHFVQLYSKNENFSNLAPYTFTKEINVNASLINSTSLSALPTHKTIHLLQTFLEGGGLLYSKTERLVSGSDTKGTSLICKQLGISQTGGSVLALEAFAQIMTLYAMGQGVLYGSEKGAPVRREELVFGLGHNARQSAVAIGRFIQLLTSKQVFVDSISTDDVAFHCIPGLIYLKTALKVVSVRAPGADASGLNRAENTIYRDFASSLIKIASYSSNSFKLMPFSSVQSILAVVPRAVQYALSQTDPFAVHVFFLYHSFQRLRTMVCTLKDRPSVALLVDCVCSRPVFLKAMLSFPELCAKLVTEASFVDAQKSWTVPRKYASVAALQRRLASLRINVDRDLKLQAAVPRSGTLSKDENSAAYNLLLKSMLNLDIFNSKSSTQSSSATFVVPFGSMWSCTPSDIGHLEFESKPVWISQLSEFASIAAVDAGQNVHLSRITAINTSGTYEGKAMHPYAITVHSDTAALVMDDSQIAALDTESYECTDIMDLSKMINSGSGVELLSGKLSQNVRAAMHNAERVFQLCLMVASQVFQKSSTEQTIYLDSGGDQGILAACACIGSAMSTSETGVAVYTHVIDSSSFPDDKERVKQTCRQIVQMCKRLSERGIKAVPFSEMCACVSIL